MSRRRMLKGQLFDGFGGTKCSMESSTWSREGLVAQKDASLLSFTQLFRGAKLVNLTNSSVAMTIPLESLDAQLSLCEDALTPLEGNLGNKDRGRIGPDSWRQSGMTWIQNQHLSTSSISTQVMFFFWHFPICWKNGCHPFSSWKPARSSESFECGRSWGRTWQGGTGDGAMVPKQMHCRHFNLQTSYLPWYDMIYLIRKWCTIWLASFGGVCVGWRVFDSVNLV